MEGKGLRSLASCWPLLLLVFLLRSLGFGSSLNDEGRALLQFRGMVEEDPFAALLDWVAGEDTLDPCNWSGVKCENGKVAVLNLTGLYLKGTLAPDVVKLFHLRSLILCNNSFYGIIPKEFGEFQKLEILDLGYNKLSGFIPSDLGKMSSLKCLITRGNHFRGGVLPSEIHYPCVLSELEVVDNISMNGAPSMTRAGGYANIRRVLEQSQTKGSTNTAEPSTLNNSPSSHSSSSKDSSHSTGTSSPKSSPRSSPTPSAPSSPTSSEPSSHGPSAPRSPPPSPPSSPPSAPSSPTPSASSSRTPSAPSSPKTGFILLGVGIGTFCLFGLLVFFYYRCNKVVMVKPWTTGLSGQLQKAFVTGVPQLKRSELETACEDFSNIIDSLSDCKLYKGTLSSGVEIAVASTLIKSAKDWSKRADSQFRKKIATLSKVNHKNFVNLVGYCEDEEPFTRMLVFEYAPNGTLSDHLRVAEDLDWAARLRISMGIAYCLDYMHQLNSPVVLGNLQLSSIYLTDDFAAKVSDFEFWSQTTVDDSATGTSGPMEKQIAQPDSIVYSFGLLLLEIITGRPPHTEDGGLLLQWVSDHQNGSKSLSGLVDPHLKSFGEDEVNAICTVVRDCCNPVPQMRPTMKEVADRLREITAVTPQAANPKVSPLWWAELEISTESS